MSEDKKWTTSRKDMDSFTTNEDGQTAHVVYLYPPDDEPRIPVFGSDPRARAESIADALNAALTLTWSTAKPTEPGWYWWRNMPLVDPEMVLIRNGDCFKEQVSMIEVLPLDIISGEWAGPIVQPTEKAS